MAQSLLEAVRRWPRWVAASQDPRAAHATVWAEIEALIGSAPFWRKRLGSQAIPGLSEFGFTTYDDYGPAIAAAFDTDQSPLNGEPIVAWVESSGSSGAVRRFPWTETYRRRYLDAAELPMPMIEQLSRLRGTPGPQLAMTSSKPSRFSPAGIPMGYATAFIAPNDGSVYPDEANASPDRIRWWRSVYALVADLRSVMCTTCEPLYRMLQQFDHDGAFYRDVLEGRRDLLDDLRPLELSDARRAYLLERVGQGPLTLLDIWPELRFVRSWRAGPAGLQAARLQATTGDAVRFVDLSYNASEGPIANPIDADDIGGPLFAEGVIHEFLDPSVSKPTPADLQKPWDLEQGKVYEVVLTTSMGMVRYRLGDFVMCTGHFHQVPKLRYHRRVRAELSLGQSMFSEDELVAVLSSVPLPPDAEIVFGPSPDGRNLVLYTSRPLPEALVDQVHASLLTLNGAYADMFAHSWMEKVAQVAAPGDPLWERLRPAHAQAKPVLLLQEPPALTPREPT